MSIIALAKEVKQTLITEQKPLFLDTNIYKYYSTYLTMDESQFIQKYQEDPSTAMSMKNCEKLFRFIIKNKIIIKKNKMLEQEIKDKILNSGYNKEKFYYEDFSKDIIFDSDVTQYTLEEENLAKQLAPRNDKKYMEHDFIIVICCNKDNTEVIVTSDRGDFRECMKVHADNKDKLPAQKSNLHLIPLSICTNNRYNWEGGKWTQ